jgi:uncharacterized protein (TIGR03435 family)
MRFTLVVLLTLAAHGQEFEVVSIKPGDPAFPGSSARSTAGGMEWRNTTVNNLIRGAYHLNEFQLTGGPKWADTERFNVDAKFPQGMLRGDGQSQQMMQHMLADRFNLVFRLETKMLPQYSLVVAKGGPKVERSSDNEGVRSQQGPRQIKAWGTPMSSLAQMLISVVSAPVTDHTGLQGQYNFSLEFAPLLDAPRENEPLGDIFAVLQQQLGLKLVATKGPVEMLVIDKVEKPTEN